MTNLQSGARAHSLQGAHVKEFIWSGSLFGAPLEKKFIYEEVPSKEIHMKCFTLARPK
jgi:hypothetical protein